MDVRKYLDSTYLKTAEQAKLSDHENNFVALEFINQAIQEEFKLIMIRPEQVKVARQKINESNSKVLVGTVIDFPLGQSGIEAKLKEAQKAIEDGADELDFVCNYVGFKNGHVDAVKEEVILCTQLALNHHKTAKWIIEVAALTEDEIIKMTTLVKNCVLKSFEESQYSEVFVKSSTGFYPTENGKPNGATRESVILMLENAGPLPVKAAGGVRSYSEAVAMIQLGVMRIGTSSAKAIIDGEISEQDY